MAPMSSRPRSVSIAELAEVENQMTAIFAIIGSRSVPRRNRECSRLVRVARHPSPTSSSPLRKRRVAGMAHREVSLDLRVDRRPLQLGAKLHPQLCTVIDSGSSPVGAKRCATVIPRLKISVFTVTEPWSSCSGAMKPGVPKASVNQRFRCRHSGGTTRGSSSR